MESQAGLRTDIEVTLNWSVRAYSPYMEKPNTNSTADMHFSKSSRRSHTAYSLRKKTENSPVRRREIQLEYADDFENVAPTTSLKVVRELEGCLAEAN